MIDLVVFFKILESQKKVDFFIVHILGQIFQKSKMF